MTIRRDRLRKVEDAVGVGEQEWCPGCHKIRWLDMTAGQTEVPPREPCPVHGTNFLPVPFRADGSLTITEVHIHLTPPRPDEGEDRER